MLIKKTEREKKRERVKKERKKERERSSMRSVTIQSEEVTYLKRIIAWGFGTTWVQIWTSHSSTLFPSLLVKDIDGVI